MNICILSSKVSSRFLRLTRIIKDTGIAENVEYLLFTGVGEDSEINFSLYDIIVLVAPFDSSIKRLILSKHISKKIVMDIAPEFSYDPIVFDPDGYISSSEEGLKYIKNDETTEAVVIDGITRIPEFDGFKRKKSNELNILIDFNYTCPEDIAKLPKDVRLSGTTFGDFDNLVDFQGISFRRALIAFDLIDLTVFDNVDLALFTNCHTNKKIVIPQTLIDCVLLGIPVYVTSALPAAQSWVRYNNCGDTLGHDQIGNIHAIFKERIDFHTKLDYTKNAMLLKNFLLKIMES